MEKGTLNTTEKLLKLNTGKELLGSYTRDNNFKRAPRPDMHPARYPNESKGSYHDRLARGKQWVSEMKRGGAHYV